MKDILPLINRLMELALTTPKDKADIFVSWHPHVNRVQIYVFPGGWTTDSVFDTKADRGCCLEAPDAAAKLDDAIIYIESFTA